MYVKLKSSFQIISLPDDFLTLKEVTEETVEFDVKYLFDQEKGIKQNATKISIDISKTLPPNSANSKISLDLYKSILTTHRDHVESLIDYQNKSVIKSQNSDPTTSVDNELVHLFNKGYNLNQLPQAKKRQLKVIPSSKKTNNIEPIHVQHDIGEYYNGERQLAEEILFRGLDPSDSYQLNDLGLSIEEAYEGIHAQSPVVFKNEDEKLLYKYKNLAFLKPISTINPGEPGKVIDTNPSTDEFVVASVQETVSLLPIIEPVKFNYNSDDQDKLYLIIKVSDVNDVTIQTIIRTFNPKDYIKFYSIPTIPPFVKTSGYRNKTHALLAVKQLDKKAKSVKIYKRVYNNHSLEDSPFTFVNELNISVEDGWKYIPLEISLGNTILYRVLSIGSNGSIGSGYSTVVLKPTQRDNNIKRVVAITTPLLNGVQIQVKHLPSDCVSFQLLREDTTFNKNSKEEISSPIYVETSDPNKEYSIEDNSVKRNHIYRYYCRIYRKNGSQFERLVTFYEHFPLIENLVDTKLINVRAQLTDLGYDVKFTIETAVVNTNLDQYKLLLERQGLYSLFNNDVLTARDQLGKLIAHNIRRVDLTTGAIEDFGTVTNTEFSDLAARSIAGVSNLTIGHKYRYVVTALLRAPETMLDTFIKTSKDTITGRNYRFSPFKFLHPIVSTYGNIVTNNSLKSHYSSDPMMFGFIGNYASTDVTLDIQLPNVTNLTCEKFGSNIDVLKWTIRGSSSDIDHFQILAEYGGKTTIIGRAICLPDLQNFQFIRNLNNFNTNVDIRYYVLPIYHDFTRGAPILASSIQRGIDQ